MKKPRDDRRPPARTFVRRPAPKQEPSPARVWRRDNPPPPPEASGAGEESLARLASATVGPGGYLSFADIPAHKLGRELRTGLYRLANALEEGERHNLTLRLKYAATTVTAALAAGFGEAAFRPAITRALESRGALYAIQDHLQQLGDLGLADPAQLAELKQKADGVIQAIGEFLGRLAQERQRLGGDGK